MKLKKCLTIILLLTTFVLGRSFSSDQLEVPKKIIEYAEPSDTKTKVPENKAPKKVKKNKKRLKNISLYAKTIAIG